MLYLKKYIILIFILNCLIVVMVHCMLFGKMLFAKHFGHTEILISSKINCKNNYYSYRLRYPCAPDGDAPSNLVLYENGVKLELAHSAHSQIKKKGKGRYSHWKANLLYFSTSDNSDPRSNGRAYKVATFHKIVIQEEVITTTFHQYQVNVQGKKGPFNRYIKIKNIGDSNIVNPKVISDNVVDMFSLQSIVSGVISDSMDNKEKAIKLWKFVRDNRYCWSPAEKIHELCDPVEYFNVYGFGFCSAAAEALESLWEEVGFSARCWGLADEHVVAEVFYNNDWHMFDPHYEIFYLNRNRKTIASIEDLENNPFLIEQAERKPVGCEVDELAKLYANKNSVIENNEYIEEHTMNMILRPNEFLIKNWEIGTKYHDNCYHQEPPVYSNGKIVYVPDLTKNNCIKGLYKKENVNFFIEDKRYPYIHIALSDKIAYVIYKVKSPYAIVGGIVGGIFKGKCKLYISFDTKNWIKIWEKEKTEDTEHYENIDVIVNNPGGGDYQTADWNPSFNAKYSYFVKYEFLSRGAGLDKVVLSTDIQIAPKSLPALKLGINNISFSMDNNKDKNLLNASQKIKITYAWEEN